MKIDFNQELKTYSGKPIVLDDKTGEKATLKFVALEALMQPSHEAISADIILQRHEMARKIWSAEEEIDLKPEDVVMIKVLIPLRFKDFPIIAAPALEMLG